MEKLQFNLDPSNTCTSGGINLDRFSSFAPQEYPYQSGIPFGLSSVSLPPVAVPSEAAISPQRISEEAF